MANAGKLERLVTDIYWRPDSPLTRSVERLLGARAGKLLGAHARSPLASSSVATCAGSGWPSFLLDKLPRAPFAWRSRATRWTDAALGRTAGRIASETGWPS